jgi:hypothetical protein
MEKKKQKQRNLTPFISYAQKPHQLVKGKNSLHRTQKTMNGTPSK